LTQAVTTSNDQTVSQQEKLDSRDAGRAVYFVLTEGSYLGRQRATETASLKLATAGDDLPLSEMYTCVQYHRWYTNLFQVQMFYYRPGQAVRAPGG
jgi:hypothetical protein